jgi:hypothetical protein
VPARRAAVGLGRRGLGHATRHARRQGLQTGQEEEGRRPRVVRGPADADPGPRGEAARRGQAGGAQAPQAPAPDDPALRTAAEPGSNPFAVQVRAGEFFLQLSKPEVHAGNVRVEFNNRTAEDPHDLHVFREDGTGASYAFGELQSGEVEARTLPLTAGTWRLLCALPEHAARGMSVKLRVVTG